MPDDDKETDNNLNSESVSVDDSTENTEVSEVEELAGEKEEVEDTVADDTPTDLPTETPKPPTKSKRLPFLIALLILTALGVLFWIFREPIVGIFVKKPAAVATEVGTNDPEKLDKSTLTAEQAAELDKFVNYKTGESWLATPKDMSAQGWLKAEYLSYYQDVGVGTSYYQSAQSQLDQFKPVYKEVGSRAGNTIILVESPEGFNGVRYLFEKRADGSVALIAHPQNSQEFTTELLDAFKQSFSEEVIIDETTRYDSINIPSMIIAKKSISLIRPEIADLAYVWDKYSNPVDGVSHTLIEQVGQGKIYRVETKYADTQLTNIGYYIDFPFGYGMSLDYIPHQTSLKDYTFDDGVKTNAKDYEGNYIDDYDELYPIARGCSIGTASITRSDSLKEADLVQIGKTNTGAAVYEPKDKSAALYKKAYDEYKDTRGDSAVGWDEFVKQHALIILKDRDGSLLVYARSDYRAAQGCAKPVVYLYPTKTTVVGVEVGAAVTISDPLYLEGGWRGVVAQPDGSLTYQNQPYDSLFWEGYGYGSYPGIVSGTVVKRDYAAATMRNQLYEQGLNSKEVGDFMEFWADKIPNKPYIRLTWFNTEQMESLAPISVSPRPDTVIRVFLDMEGYDQPIYLPKQLLKHNERNGFTVVEWGGLLAGKLQ